MSGLVVPIATGAMAVGSGLSAYAQTQSGKAAAAIGEYNAKLDLESARVAREAGQMRGRDIREEGVSFISSQQAGFGSAGVSSSSGSALMTLIESAKAIEKDALNAERAGEVRARDFESSAVAERFRGKSARRQSRYQAFGTLLSGAGRAGSLYLRGEL